MHSLNTSLALLLAIVAGSSNAQDDPVTGKEIVEKWSGKELSGIAPNGVKAFMKFEADGRISIVAASFSDTGTWRPWESGYCTTWTTIRAGQERCFTVTRSGERITVTNPDGSLSGHFTSLK